MAALHTVVADPPNVYYFVSFFPLCRSSQRADTIDIETVLNETHWPLYYTAGCLKLHTVSGLEPSQEPCTSPSWLHARRHPPPPAWIIEFIFRDNARGAAAAAFWQNSFLMCPSKLAHCQMDSIHRDTRRELQSSARWVALKQWLPLPCTISIRSILTGVYIYPSCFLFLCTIAYIHTRPRVVKWFTKVWWALKIL